MKACFLLLLLTLPLTGVPEDVDPFSDELSEQPHHIRVEVRHIEITSTLLPKVSTPLSPHESPSDHLTQKANS